MYLCIIFYALILQCEAITLSKKLYYVAISKDLDPELAPLIGEEFDKIIEKYDPDLSTYITKEKAAEELLNSEYKEVLKIKKALQKINKFAKGGVHVRKDGFSCDRRFCAILGNGHHAIGVCSPYSCWCKKKEPHPGNCGMKRIFNPLVQRCKFVEDVSICGRKLT